MEGRKEKKVCSCNERFINREKRIWIYIYEMEKEKEKKRWDKKKKKEKNKITINCGIGELNRIQREWNCRQLKFRLKTMNKSNNLNNLNKLLSSELSFKSSWESVELARNSMAIKWESASWINCVICQSQRWKKSGILIFSTPQ